MKKNIIITIYTLFLVFPIMVYAQVGDTIKDFFGSLESLVSDAISGFLLTAATAAFLFNVVRFILARNSSNDGLKDAKEKLLWSVIALTVAFSIWGIVQFLQTGFGFKGKTTIAPPVINIETK